MFSRMAFSITNHQAESFVFQTTYDRMLPRRLMTQLSEVAMRVS